MKKLILVFPFILVGIVCIFYFYSLQPVGGSGEKMFIINRGESTTTIAQRLEDQNLIRNKWAFLVFLNLTGQQGKLQAGGFRLSPRYSAGEIAKLLQSGKVDTWITFIEGERKEEYALKLEESLNLSAEDFLNLEQAEEGYLSPDSYLFPTDYGVDKITAKLRETFNRKWDDLDLSQASLSQEEIVILASLVEREANTDESRQIVAGILIKRWENDWPLQVDATVQYLKANRQCKSVSNETADDCNWWPKVTGSDLQNFDSPYNTYKYKGLPPAPICNPSLAAIKAVINPQITGYWYYLTGKDGEMYYSETLEEHNQKIQRYLGT